MLAGIDRFVARGVVGAAAAVERGDDGVEVRIVEQHQRDELLVRIVLRWWGDAMDVRAPTVVRPSAHQESGVDGEGALDPRSRDPFTVGENLEPSTARLPVEDGERAVVGVWTDAELAWQRRRGECRPGQIPVEA